MKLTKQQESEVLPIYKEWWHSYLNGDVKTYDHYLDADYRFVGSTAAEDFLSKGDSTQFFDTTADQLAGKLEKRNTELTTEFYDGLIFITELTDSYFLSGDEWTFYGKFRLSSILRKTSEGWRFIYQHFSVPDSKAQEGETIGFDQVSKENQELRDAIKRRTTELEAKNRDLEIEAALERVRARTMAMQKTVELGEVISLIFEELDELNIAVGDGVALITFKEDSKDLNEWMANKGFDTAINFHLPYFDHPVLSNLWNAKEQGKKQFFQRYSAEENRSFLDHIFEHSDFRHTPDSVKEYCLAAETYATTIAFQKHTAIFINDYSGVSLSESEITVLERFSQVFEQTFIRFKDLEKAEAQVREAQVETALERIRSKTMGMQKSEDLADISLELVKQVQELGNKVWFCAFNIYDDDPQGSLEWGSNGQGTFPKYRTPREGVFLRYYKAGQQGESLLINEIGEEECPAHYDYLCSLSGVGEQLLGMKAAGIPFPTSQIDHVAFFKFGYVLFITYDPAPEAHDIFKRFAKVFEQSYTRFLDLQKAEAQAREAQIEAALERTRTQSMLMQHSDELDVTARVFHEQLVLLGIDSEFSYVWLPDVSQEKHMFWAAWNENEIGAIQSKSVVYDLDKTEPYTAACFEAWEGGQTIHIHPIPPEEVKRFFETWSELLSGAEKLKAKYFKEGLYYAEAYIKYGCFGINIRRQLTAHEKQILEKFAIQFERTYARFLDLQKAEALTREAQIETALEKVRSRTMAMQKGEDLKDVVVLLYKELIALGVTNFVTCGYVEVKEDKQIQDTWVTSPGGDTFGLFYLPLQGDATFDERYAAWKNQEPIFHQTVGGEVRSKHLEYAITKFNSKEAEEMVRGQFPDPTVFYCFNFSHGYLHIVGGSLLEEEEEILLARFTKVFEQTYTRFLDLKKAEAQAKEAQIEAALEKVRSRSLAMQTANELGEVVVVIAEKLQEIGVILDANGIILCTYFPESKDVLHWITSPDYSFAGSYLLPYFDHPIFNDAWQSKENGNEYFSKSFSVEQKNSFFEYAFEHSDYKHFPEEFKQWVFQNDKHSLSFAWQKNSAILIPSHTGIVPSPDEVQILKRFALVFEQAYTRFLDLQKAEEQAKEAQVELSLERIRAQVTAMQESSDLFDVVVSMRKEFLSMGHEADYFWHMQWLQDAYDMSMTSDDGSRVGMVISIPKFVHEAISDLNEWEKGDEPILVLPLNADAAWDYIENMNTHGRYEQADPNAPTQEDIQHIGGLTFIIARTTHGEIGYSLAGEVPNPPKDALNTLERFAGVFDLAYTRFEDLKANEHQHRETQVELSLERIRAQAMAMKVSTDLLNIVVKMRTEFINLGHEAHYFWYMRWLPEKYDKAMTSGDGTKVGMVMELPRHIHGDIKLLADWEKSNDPTVVYAMDVETAIDYVGKMVELGDFKQVDPNAPTMDDIRHIGGLTFIMTKTTYGEIGYSLPGVVPNPPLDDLNTLKRFASAFDLAYGRFEDLQKAEDQAMRAERDLVEIKIARKKAEDALKELQATQKQLIHSEKMASLGELTAGIAHEIQNPLNFVNNFSELSVELIDEMSEELDNGDTEEAKAIAIDLKDNLSKINHHGKRAEGIVKGMLEHSKTSSGVKEPTDINALCDEYLRLAYHGLRAKDKFFNSKFETDFDTSISKIDVVPQDIGRVVLNLITNAFYAVNERSIQKEEGFEPRVVVSTKRVSESVIIKVKDNGNGIPENIKEKIFQPFFTTKPTGQGTGLGLSLSYDIVKAHGGELRVETKVGEGLPAGASAQAGSEFFIQLST